MRTESYPSDLTDAQWSLIEPHLPVYPGGRPRKTELPDVVDAIFYILRTGCQWRYLPKDFPPRAPSGNTSTSGDTTAPSKRSTTCSAARSAQEKPTRPGPRQASTASRSTPPPAASSGAGTTPRTSTAGNAISSWTAWVADGRPGDCGQYRRRQGGRGLLPAWTVSR